MANVTKGEILPCPCCAWTGWKLTHDPTCFVGQTYEKEPASDGFQIRCDKCGLQTCWWHHREQAVIAWNIRPSAQVRNEALEEAAEVAENWYCSNLAKEIRALKSGEDGK